VNQLLLGIGGILLLASVGWLQGELDRRQDRTVIQIEGLAQLPKGEYLKPALLGYHHLGADILWLRLVQVIGKKRNTADEYEWMYHALDVITTLDPQYAYAYYAGGVILGDLANRPDLSIRLLEKGVSANPSVWNIPFLLGYNYYFLLGDPTKGAEYIMKAASLPDGPSYLPGLATRMAAEAGSPDTALAFLEARLRETQDPQTRESLANRMKEVIIERDLRILESGVEVYRTEHQTLPSTLADLVASGILPMLPEEPFGGDYRLDPRAGSVSSSTHPERLRTFFKRPQPTYSFPKVEPSYSFPRTWE
jgi:tetratricopeptide (TPR) repeat protein